MIMQKNIVIFIILKYRFSKQISTRAIGLSHDNLLIIAIKLSNITISRRLAKEMFK